MDSQMIQILKLIDMDFKITMISMFNREKEVKRISTLKNQNLNKEQNKNFKAEVNCHYNSVTLKKKISECELKFKKIKLS